MHPLGKRLNDYLAKVLKHTTVNRLPFSIIYGETVSLLFPVRYLPFSGGRRDANVGWCPFHKTFED